MRRWNWICSGLLAASALFMFFVGSSAHAATRNMVGSIGVINPSVAPPFFFTSGPQVLGKKQGPYAPDKGWTTVDVAGTTATTFVGRQLTLAAGKLDFSGQVFRDFKAFPSVANQTKSYSNRQTQPQTFAVGQGALAQCPGNGCTFSSYTTTTGGITNTVVVPGTAISWCPPTGEPVGTPSPGTPSNQVGDWNCASQQGAATGAYNMRMAVSNSPGANQFGGTYDLLRTNSSSIWRVLVQPGTDGVAEVSRTLRGFEDLVWTPGPGNFRYQTYPGRKGPRLKAYLNANGAVTQTLGCVNPTGTIGAGNTFVPGQGVITGQGSNCGTPTTIPPPQQGWGFRLTTGDVEGSDPFPFISVTSAVPPGTAFAPNVNARTPNQGFFFSRMGTDRTTAGTRRNIVLLGGGAVRDPGSGNLFFRIMDLRLDMTVPEPAMGLGLVAGATALVALMHRRRD